jgi:hypothetical protein
LSLVRIHNFAISLDGFGTGEGRSRDAHFRHAGGVEKNYQVEATSSPSGVTYVTFTRARV